MDTARHRRTTLFRESSVIRDAAGAIGSRDPIVRSGHHIGMKRLFAGLTIRLDHLTFL
jgi:hypothetical protein